jgi:hypothetical protein
MKFVYCSPFTSDPTLKTIISGIVADPEVNDHDFESIGSNIIEYMIGESAFTYKFKRKDRAQSLGNISAVKIAPSFLVVSRSRDLSLDEVLTFDLSPARDKEHSSESRRTSSGNTGIRKVIFK